MQKISILINSFTAGGAERVVSLLLEELKSDFDIHLVLLSNIIEYPLPQGQKIFCLDQPVDGNGFLKIFNLPFLARRYKKYCRENNIETSISFLKRANFINCLSRMSGSRCRTIISERTFLTDYLKVIGTYGRITSGFLTRMLYPKADLIITNSALIKEDLIKNFKVRTNYQVIPNPVNLPAIQLASKEYADPSIFSGFTFITVAAFREGKNYEKLIEAFEIIRDLDCRLILVGKGADESKIRTRVLETGLGSRIIFTGFDNNPYKYLSRASCFVLSSDFEGFPNSIQEALACNLPVISTDCRSGPREILAPDTDINLMLTNELEVARYGILVPVNNAVLLAEAMRLVYNDVDLRNKLQQAAAQRVLDYDLPGISEKFKNVFSGEREHKN